MFYDGVFTTLISLRLFPCLSRHHNKHSAGCLFTPLNQGQKSSILKFSVTDVYNLTNFSLLLMMVVPHTLIVSLGINGINSRDYSHGLRFCWIKIVTGFNMYRVIRDTLSKVTFSKWGILSARISPQPARVCSLILGYCVSILYINTYCDSILPQ